MSDDRPPGYPSELRGVPCGRLRKEELVRCDLCDEWAPFAYGPHRLCHAHARSHPDAVFERRTKSR